MGRFKVIDNNMLDKQGILNLLKHFIFGNHDISIYDQNKIYNAGDKSFIIDTTTGDITVVTASDDNITGPYDESKWNTITLADTVGSGADKVVVISQYRPRELITKIWLTPDEFSTHYIAMPGYKPGTEPDNPDDPNPPIIDPNENGIILLFHEDEIPIVNDTGTADLAHLDIGELVFDIEGESIITVDGLTDIDTDVRIIVDEQGDVSVNNTKPGEEKIVLWIDTDLSDDIW